LQQEAEVDSAYRCSLTVQVVYCLQSNFQEVVEMKRFITYICLLGALLLILDSFDAVHSLVLFILFGVIPGTNMTIAPIDMMAAIATAITVIVLRLTLWNHIHSLLFVPSKPVTSPRSKQTRRRTA
jgi:hypothetical protein